MCPKLSSGELFEGWRGRQGELDGALEHARRALEILEGTYGSDNPLTRIAAKNLAALEKLIAGSGSLTP